MKDTTKKFDTVITKNTFYFYDREFEEKYEGYINSIKETLLVLKNQIQNKGLKEELFEDLIYKGENGLRALLALTGFSNESLKRLLTFIRIINDPKLNALIFKEKWITEVEESDIENIEEWTDNKIQKMIQENEFFRKGLVNIFFKGSTIPILYSALPLFELKKLSISKLNFEIDALIDTLVRYKEKGSYSGKKENNPEVVITSILKDMEIGFDKGDLGELISNAPDKKRTMDFIIPDKINPRIIIECSYLVTTSSGQGDKSKTEIAIDSLIKAHYPGAHFIGFIDGIGWYVRKNDLKRMVNAYEDVFTFHKDELKRFKQLLKEVLVND
jgi:hypothetical protein